MTKVYTGICDAHGLESFIECDEVGKTVRGMGWRARANRQRHATVYWVELNPDRVRQMKDLIKTGDWIACCELLKDSDFTEMVYIEDEMKRSWKMLPNPELDPYWSPPEDAGYYETTDAKGMPL